MPRHKTKYTVRAVEQFDIAACSGGQLHVVREWQPAASDFVCVVESTEDAREYLNNEDRVTEFSAN